MGAFLRLPTCDFRIMVSSEMWGAGLGKKLLLTEIFFYLFLSSEMGFVAFWCILMKTQKHT